MTVNGQVSKMVVIMPIIVINNISRYVVEHVTVSLDPRCVTVQVQTLHAPLRVVTEVVYDLLPVAAQGPVEEVYAAWVRPRLAVLPGRTGVVAGGLIRTLAKVFDVVELDDIQRRRGLTRVRESRMDSRLCVDSVVVDVVHKVVTYIRAYNLVDEHAVARDVWVGVRWTRFAWFRVARVRVRWPRVAKASAVVDLSVGHGVVATRETSWVARLAEVNAVAVSCPMRVRDPGSGERVQGSSREHDAASDGESIESVVGASEHLDRPPSGAVQESCCCCGRSL